MFILSNSFNNYEASHSSSENITDIIISESKSIEIIIRKIAHIVEFAALGVFTVVFIIHIRKRYVRQVFGYALFYVLAVSESDDYRNALTYMV